MRACPDAVLADAAAPAERTQLAYLGGRFPDDERHLLLTTPGIGQGVVSRIELAGVHTLRQLHDLGVDALVEQICDGVGNLAWRNRRRALTRALSTLDALKPRPLQRELHTPWAR